MHRKLERFLTRQEEYYPQALAEIRAGYKEGHWMWFIFPQLRGLGRSNESWYYGLEDLREAGDYLDHPVLGPRLREITGALLELDKTHPWEIFGGADSRKLCSCMTLFALVAEDEAENPFARVLEQYFHGQGDYLTETILREKGCL